MDCGGLVIMLYFCYALTDAKDVFSLQELFCWDLERQLRLPGL